MSWALSVLLCFVVVAIYAAIDAWLKQDFVRLTSAAGAQISVRGKEPCRTVLGRVELAEFAQTMADQKPNRTERRSSSSSRT